MLFERPRGGVAKIDKDGHVVARFSSFGRGPGRLDWVAVGKDGAVFGRVRPLEGHDFVQTSLSPCVRPDFDRAWFRVAYTQNLDAPFGPSEANVTWWGVKLGTGVRF